MSYLLVFLLSGVLGMAYWHLAIAVSGSGPATSQVTKPSQEEQPPTLLDLFLKKDFQNTLRMTDNDPALTVNWPDGTATKIRRQIYMDFPAKTKFIGFYVAHPMPPSADTSDNKSFNACMKFLEKDVLQQAFGDLEKKVAILGGHGAQADSIDDLTFSGRVVIYHEELLSIPQQADIIRAYAAKQLDVQFYGPVYLSSQVIAWHQRTEARRK